MTGPYEVIADQADGHETWLEERRGLLDSGYVGASEVATLMGENPYQPALYWYLERIGEREGFSGNAHSRRGQRFEDTIIQHVRAEGILDAAPFGKLLRSTKHPVSCTPDARTISPEKLVYTVQVKDTTHVWDTEDAAEGPPLMYQLQIQSELIVTEWDGGILQAYDGDKQFPNWFYPPHEGAQAAILEAVKDGLRRVRELDPYPIEVVGKNLRHMKDLWKEDTDKTVDLPEEALDRSRELTELRQQIRELKAALKVKDAQAKEIEAWFWNEMRDAQRGVLPDGAGAYTLKTTHVGPRTQEAYSYRVLRKVKS